MRSTRWLGGWLCASMMLVASCGTGGAASTAGGTFTMAVPEDPGNLDPLLASSGLTRRINRFLYDPLLHLRPDGTLAPGLATAWTTTPTSATFTLKEGVTCADGSPLTASDVAATFGFIADPANGSALLGVAVTPGVKVGADDAARTVTLTVADPDPFLARKTTSVFVVCRKGLTDPAGRQRGGYGTGLFKLTEAVPEDHYTLVRRPEYAWGPGGVSGREPRMPGSAVVKVVKNETTAANLLLSGQVNVAEVNGPDRDRLDAASMFKREDHTMIGELFFNQADGHPGRDQKVRQALVAALDITELAGVIAGKAGRVPQSLVAQEPKPCTGDAVTRNLPAHDAARAKELLAGGAPRIRLVYLPAYGEGVAPAAELIAQRWRGLGVQVELKSMSPSQSKETLYGTGAWDVSMIPVNASLPSQLAAFLSGPTPPDGNNFAHIDNPDYLRLVKQAMALPADQGCARWLAAEEALLRRFDVVPFSESPTPVYGNAVTFDLVTGGVVPSSVRLTTG
ncbi:ABC transporter substrate-binding protein [Microtetraspora malaysiensis]|uniref:ABC transporter substrate-binding protein n=1 Tax=Microtetraspora malaysiensis TaxID=161358 RepID=A0ABW6T1U2_9ACTN